MRPQGCLCEQLQTNSQTIDDLTQRRKGEFMDEETLKFDLRGGIIWPGREWGKWYSRPRKQIEQEYGIWYRQVYLSNNEQILLNVADSPYSEKQRETKLASWLHGTLRGKLEHSVDRNCLVKEMSSVGFQGAPQCQNCHREVLTLSGRWVGVLWCLSDVHICGLALLAMEGKDKPPE